ncbi:MAG: nitronate monooxygenase [Bacteriovoracaceae bacterium]|nr:nitronate monooxygenase [Bacteriovoracaceae bacterium]
MNLPLIIQGGMGVGVSDWRLAKTVSTLGQLGVVSGTGINTVLIRRLQNGDAKGDVRRAMSSFPDPQFVQGVLKLYFLAEGRPKGKSYLRSPLPSINPPLFFQRLNVLASFVEVFLAKENHEGIIGINFLEKLQTSNLSGIYGAMLARVDYVLMGAGIPREIPGVLDLFSEQKEVSVKANFISTKVQSNIQINFDPAQILPNHKNISLKRPKFLAIVSSDTLATHLASKSTGHVDGFIIEGYSAGGHNAPPRGPLHLSTIGEPIYGLKDQANLEAIKKIGLPFWMAGTFGSPEKIKQALNLGAVGVQVGTAFAFCNESGLSKKLREDVIKKWCFTENSEPLPVFTDPQASPTGFPFKVVPLEKTLSEHDLYLTRRRKCDLGYLRQAVLREDGSIVYRCSAEPVNDFVAKGGQEKDTLNCKCLCNALLSNIGLGQIQENEQENGYEELPLLTAGDDIIHLKQFLPKNKKSYSAQDVINYLINDIKTA